MQLYMIILTALAIFGLYNLFELVFSTICMVKGPKSIILMEYSNSFDMRNKIKYFQNTILNNKIALVSMDNTQLNLQSELDLVNYKEISQYIANDLFTNCKL